MEPLIAPSGRGEEASPVRRRRLDRAPHLGDLRKRRKQIRVTPVIHRPLEEGLGYGAEPATDCAGGGT